MYTKSNMKIPFYGNSLEIFSVITNLLQRTTSVITKYFINNRADAGFSLRKGREVLEHQNCFRSTPFRTFEVLSIAEIHRIFLRFTLCADQKIGFSAAAGKYEGYFKSYIV